MTISATPTPIKRTAARIVNTSTVMAGINTVTTAAAIPSSPANRMIPLAVLSGVLPSRLGMVRQSSPDASN
jgi:hypothetical protein